MPPNSPLPSLELSGSSNASKAAQAPLVASQQLQKFPEISELVIASYQRLWTTASLAVILAFLAGLTAFLIVPANYLATSTVRILQREGHVLTNQQSRAEDGAFVRAQQLLVSQEPTLSLALNDPEFQAHTKSIVTDDLVAWLRSQIKVEMPIGSETMTITASSLSPDLAVHASRAVTKAYASTITEQIRSSRERRLSELERTTSEVDAKLMLRWRELQSKAGKIGSGNPQSMTVSEQLKLQNYRESSQRLRSLQFQKSQAELLLSTERTLESPEVGSQETLVLAAVSTHPEVVALKEHVRRVEIKILEMQKIAKETSAPQLVRLRNEREQYLAAQSQAEARIGLLERAKLSERPASGPSAKVRELEGQLALLEQEITQLQDATTQIESSMVDLNGAQGIELEILRHEIEREERLSDNLWKTLQEFQIESRAEPRVAVVALPMDSVRMSRAKQGKATLAAALIGIAVAILGVGFFEWSCCLVRHSDDIRKTSLPLFGNSNKRHDNLVVTEIASQLILRANEKGVVPSVLVTSASDGEPRWLLSQSLASAVAKTGRRVLLVACGDQPSMDGLSTLDSRSSSTDTYVTSTLTKTSVEFGFDFTCIPSGAAVLRWTSSKEMPSFLNDMKLKYDSIIFVGPAVLTQPETMLMAAGLDLTILVAAIGQSRWDLLIDARNRLQLPTAKLVGTVLIPKRWRPTRSAFRSSASTFDASAATLVPTAEEQEILSTVNDLQEDFKQFDTGSPMVAAPRISSVVHQKQPIAKKRTSK